ncbi:MAG: KilA-N domain-containing protein [Tannerellaceae bacterium]|nr:KilA-N domain-containing protein [Tannerellaceae bacterium]
MAKITVKNTNVTVIKINNTDYISLTDIAKFKTHETFIVICNWLRNRNTIEYLGIWKSLYNGDFKPIEFDRFRKEAGLNAFTLSPQKWITSTNAIGIISKSGRYGGTFAHKDIAFKFASWISVEFELYIIKEFQRLKEEEQKQIGWSAKRELSKINYHIHTDAIKQNLIPVKLTSKQTSVIYASEADILNVALFGMTAKEWREQNPEQKGNIRDYATINELICLSNMENLNAVFINEGLNQKERLIKLNQIGIQQMKILQEIEERQYLKSEEISGPGSDSDNTNY